MRRLLAKDEIRIRRSIQDRLMSFSPTISPAPKNIERGEIESIFEGLKYFQNAGVERCILQPKYMGSYCDIYLNKELEKTKFFSRGGFNISSRLISTDKLLKIAKPLHDAIDWKNLELVVIQAELLPWSALGKGLIENDFSGYAICHESYANYLRDSDLKTVLEGQLTDSNFYQYLKDLTLLSEKDLKEKYSSHVVEQYELLRELKIPNYGRYRSAIDLFKAQLDIYSKEAPLEFKPFNILKKVWSPELNREDWIGLNNIDNFKEISRDEFCIIELNQQNLDSGYSEAYDYFNNLVSNEMEGIIIKPEVVWNKDLVPAFKIRNNNYLQMIYGVRFQDGYDDFLKRRAVGKKMKCSINEWNISQAMLRIQYRDIGPKNQEYVDLIIKRILEEDFESKLDIRL